MQQIATETDLTAHPLATCLIGGLLMHGALDFTKITARAAYLGLDSAATARAMLDLVDRRLASIMRTGDVGELIATPDVENLATQYRVRCILAFLMTGARAPLAGQGDA